MTFVDCAKLPVTRAPPANIAQRQIETMAEGHRRWKNLATIGRFTNRLFARESREARKIYHLSRGSGIISFGKLRRWIFIDSESARVLQVRGYRSRTSGRLGRGDNQVSEEHARRKLRIYSCHFE